MIKDFEAIRITLASPEDILAWSHGEVTKAETINYRSFRPEVDGLMDERIFGPTQDFACFCGKYKKIRYKGIVCDRCGVEVTHKRVRRERMGHIRLVSPVTHVWFSHGVPNKLALILDIPQKKLETVIYYARYAVTSVEDEGKDQAIKEIKEIATTQIADLEKELEGKLAEISAEYAEQTEAMRKAESDEKKLGVQIERQKTEERKKQAHIKSAYSQKLENLKDKFRNLENLVGQIEVGFTLSEDENTELMSLGFSFYQADMGAPAVEALLQNLNLEEEITALDELISTTKSELKKSRAIQRKKLLKGMHVANIDPTWVVLNVLPVLPPDLRPIIQLPGGRFATSDLNDLYRRVINRNNRLKRLMELGAPQIILRNERRMLQEAVDALLDNSHRPGAPTINPRGLPYKSLSDQLRGKQGRFRQNLLGKRVDYSGRAVIVTGPELKYYQCGLPKNIALELFKPFIIRELVGRGLAANPARARMIYEEKTPEVWDILEEVSKDRPVLLNRAPTLHKQGIVAFNPVLIEGNSIKLHPLMCKGFNADFDGDQMAVHLPLSRQAVEEVRERMFAPSNMLSMANGQPIMNTEKDMAMGIYFLTLMEGKDTPEFAFANSDEAISKYKLGDVTLYEPIKILMNGELMTTTVGRIIFNQILPEGYGFVNKTLGKKDVQAITSNVFNKYGRDEAIVVLDHIKDLGFKYARQSGFSVSMEEFEFGADEVVSRKLAEFNKSEEELLNNYYEGLITQDELQRLKRDLWVSVYEALGDETWNLAKQKSGNLTHLNESGATPVASWVRQISGAKGTVTDPSGNVVDLPLINNYKNGLNNFEYFVAARGTRKSFADVALRTADSGYLTRRLVDVAQDVVVKEEDCGTTEGVYLTRADKRNQSFANRLKGRFLAEDIADPKTGEIIAKSGELVTLDIADKIAANESIDKAKVRSPLTCKTTHGVCRKCYGSDFGTGKPVELGEAVGIIAAQSLGEPTTQLTLKNKSDARASRADVTQGLPRVEELFEVRTPKAKALVADISGTVKIVQNEDDVTIRLSTVKKLKKTYEVGEGDKVVAERAKLIGAGETVIVRADGSEVKSDFDAKVEVSGDKLFLLIDKEIESEMRTDAMSDLMVKNGEFVEAGTQLTYGSVDPKELADYVDIFTAQKYIIEGVQAVYGIYGLEIDDVHLELILAQMARFAQVTDAGDSTETLVGEFKDILEIEGENTKLSEEGKRAMLYEQILLGLTNAALKTESFLSAASFEQQVRILTDAALVGKVDKLRGLKENVIIGRPVPIGNMFKARMQGEGSSIDFDISG